jgi:hypothetical protein
MANFCYKNSNQNMVFARINALSTPRPTCHPLPSIRWPTSANLRQFSPLHTDVSFYTVQIETKRRCRKRPGSRARQAIAAARLACCMVSHGCAITCWTAELCSKPCSHCTSETSAGYFRSLTSDKARLLTCNAKEQEPNRLQLPAAPAPRGPGVLTTLQVNLQ